jgi:DNA (cytosine-5)-methyltransferase 1
MNAGWDGLFAIEKEPNAFATLSANLLGVSSSRPGYWWPEWLPKSPLDISQVNRKYTAQLTSLAGHVDLIAGGPPCQGFSMAGRRRMGDRRNRLISYYLQAVGLIQPKFLLIENVQGIAIEFDKGRREERGERPGRSFADRIRYSLETNSRYRVYSGVVRAADIGVPQTRPRFIMLGIRSDVVARAGLNEDPFCELQDLREHFLAEKQLPLDRPVTAKEALSDLETTGKPRVPCDDAPGFEQTSYTGPRTIYQRLLHDDMGSRPPNSMRLAKHRPETCARFELALEHSRRGVHLSKIEKQRLGLMKKHQFTVLDPDKPSHTLTTLPDDLLHYSEPRILTVRESARLQSFPDWFQFEGKYTTGGERRKHEAPRYTQVGNAVPPFLAEILGILLMGYYTADMNGAMKGLSPELREHLTLALA